MKMRTREYQPARLWPGPLLRAVIGLSLCAAPVGAHVVTTPVHAEHIGPAVAEVLAADEARIEDAIAGLAEQDVEFVDVDVCIDPDRFRLSATAALSVASNAPVIELSLNERLTVVSVTRDGRPLRFLRDGDALAVRPGPLAEPVTSFIVRYEGALSSGDEVLLQRGFVFLGGGAHWYPAPRYGDLCRIRTVARYPESYASVCTGGLAGMTPSRTDSSHDCALGDVWDTGGPVPSAAIAVGTFASSYSVWGDVFLGYHMLVAPGEGTPEGMEASAAEVKGLVSYLESCYGPYPFDWLSVVSVPASPAALPNSKTGPGVVVVTDSDWTGSRLRSTRPDRVVGALSKSWWPYSIDAGPIVSEGLAAHSEIALLGEVGDEEAAVRRRDFRRGRYVSALSDSGGRAPLRSCIVPRDDIDMRVCGTRSQSFFGILEQVVGREVFCSVLGDLSSRFSGDMLPLRELLEAFEAEDGRDLDWLFYEWVYRGDLPTYVLDYDVRRGEDGYVVSGSLTQLGEIFRTPIPLTVDLGVWSYDEWIAVDSPDQHFELATELEPQSISIDSGHFVPRIEADELADVHFGRGQRAVEANEWGSAVDEFGAATELIPTNATYREQYGSALVHSGRLDLGLAALEEAVELAPDDPDFRMILARLYLVSGRSGDALRHLDRYVSLRSDDPEGHIVRVMALIELGRMKDAQRDVSLASSLADSVGAGSDVLELLSLARGRFHEAAGDTALAVQAYNEVLELNPVSDEARRSLGRLVRDGE